MIICQLCHTLADAAQAPSASIDPLCTLQALQGLRRLLALYERDFHITEALLRLLSVITSKHDCRQAIRQASLLQASISAMRLSTPASLRFLQAVFSKHDPNTDKDSEKDSLIFGSVAGGMGLDLVLRYARSHNIPADVIDTLPNIISALSTHEGSMHRLVVLGLSSTLVTLLPRLSPSSLPTAISVLSRSLSAPSSTSIHHVTSAAAEAILRILSIEHAQAPVQAAGLTALAQPELSDGRGKKLARAAHVAMTEHASNSRVIEACASVFLVVPPVDIISAACSLRDLAALLKARRRAHVDDSSACKVLAEAVRALHIVVEGAEEVAVGVSAGRFSSTNPRKAPRSRSGGMMSVPRSNEAGGGLRKSFGGVAISNGGNGNRNGNRFTRKGRFGCIEMMQSGDAMSRTASMISGRIYGHRRSRSDFVVGGNGSGPLNVNSDGSAAQLENNRHGRPSAHLRWRKARRTSAENGGESGDLLRSRPLFIKRADTLPFSQNEYEKVHKKGQGHHMRMAQASGETMGQPLKFALERVGEINVWSRERRDNDEKREERHQNIFRHVPWVEARLMKKSPGVGSNDGTVDTSGKSRNVTPRGYGVPVATEEMNNSGKGVIESNMDGRQQTWSKTSTSRTSSPLGSGALRHVRRPSLPAYVPEIPDDDDDEEYEDDFDGDEEEYEDDFDDDNEKTWDENNVSSIQESTKFEPWAAGSGKDSVLLGDEEIHDAGKEVDKLLDAEEENETEEDVNNRIAARDFDVRRLIPAVEVNTNQGQLEVDTEVWNGNIESGSGSGSGSDSGYISKKFGERERERKRSVEVSTTPSVGNYQWNRPDWSIWPVAADAVHTAAAEPRSYPNFHPRVESGSLPVRR